MQWFKVFTSLAALYFLVQWKNEDDVLYDIVPNKHIIVSEGVDILDITVGSICNTLYHENPFLLK